MSLVLALLCLIALPLQSGAEKFRSASVDTAGQLHIVLRSGQELLREASPNQLGFDQPKIAADSRTIGWLVLYPQPGSEKSDYHGAPYPLELALYRSHHIIQTFATGQIFWDWQFQASGKRVAYSTGPTHGGATEFTLCNVDSGRKVASWFVSSGKTPPEWAKTLRR